jgi:hypothetical protein
MRGDFLPQISTDALDLPSPDTKRWIPRRKAIVVEAVRSGAIKIDDACRRYALSREEFAAWEQAIQSNGVPGLRATRLQIYRDTSPARPVTPRH